IRNVVEIAHSAHIDPRLRDGNDNIRLTETESVDEQYAGIRIRHRFPYQILAGDAEMDCALCEIARDLSGGEISDLDAADLGNRAAIVASAAPLHQRHAGPREKGMSVFHEPALGGHTDDDGGAHAAPACWS